MHFDLLQAGAAAAALMSVFGLWKAVVTPFKKLWKLMSLPWLNSRTLSKS
ncbi:hypothetical protein HMPREF1231_0426 [Streptococcus pyogenes GA06023]|nr:hypothetical protein HMPREF1231_0426 [Streptococcus pyogenes GA06023]